MLEVVQAGRARKTELFLTNQQEFMRQMVHDIRALIRKAKREGMRPAVRLNGTSDIPWENVRFRWLGQAVTIMEMFPSVQFYDYTKSIQRMEQQAAGLLPDNYDLTFSRSESNDHEVNKVLDFGGRVAIVYTVLPEGTYNGDDSDARFLESAGIVGLTAKGRAKHDTTGFVVLQVAADDSQSAMDPVADDGENSPQDAE